MLSEEISYAYQVGPFQISLQGGWISLLLRPHRFSAGRRPKKIERLKGLGGERWPSAHAVGGRKEGWVSTFSSGKEAVPRDGSRAGGQRSRPAFTRFSSSFAEGGLKAAPPHRLLS